MRRLSERCRSSSKSSTGNPIAPTRLYSTDIADRQLGEIRDYVTREKLTNVTVLKGDFAATNLPPACCDVIFMRNVYHHLREPEVMMRSVTESLKPGGHIAIVDFVARPGSQVPDGVRANRGGKGIPLAILLEEMAAVGFKHVRTIDGWPPGEKNRAFLALFSAAVDAAPLSVSNWQVHHSRYRGPPVART